MLNTLRTKIRALVEDFTKSDFETFDYTTSKIWTLAESNIVSINEVLRNGSALGSGEYSYDSTTNKIEILISLTTTDKIEVDYTYNKYSDTELDEYVKAALVWISVFSSCESDYEIEDTTIFPTPDNRTIDLISLIASILIKPDYNEYRLPNLTVRYLRTKSKEDKIQSLIVKFQRGLGINCVLEFS